MSYKIAENYFGNKYYVWCSPYFNATGVNPPSSDPCEIYNGLLKDVIGKDRHSAKVSMNKTGLLKATDIKFNAGDITLDQKNEIIDIIGSSELDDFRPLIYVIPFENVKALAKAAPIKLKADRFSKEYIIEDLQRSHFDVIDIYKNVSYV